MLDTDTFLTTLYVMVDDFAKASLPQVVQPGPRPSLERSEVVTLAVFGQWARFHSERDFYGWAWSHLRAAFPTLPARTQLNRLVRHHASATTAFFLYLSERLEAHRAAYQALDSTALVVREAKRRGRGWLAGQADIGWSNRLGWYEGLHLLLSVDPLGVITGLGLCPASTKDQPMAETFFAARHRPQPALASVGAQTAAPYVTDKGFEGYQWHQHWSESYGAAVITLPKRDASKPWPLALRRFVARVRQIVETVNEKLHYAFRLSRERPHALSGAQARVAAKAALHNFCIWVNRQLHRPGLAFADLVDW
jgi:DDE family transposase